MPRIAEGRSAAEPSSPRQKERHRRILRAAAELAAENGLERVQMHDVARDAAVAIGTLYRYFPSKTHLFTAVMLDEVEQLDANTPALGPEESPEDAVSGLLIRVSRNLSARPLLAMAMVQSNIVARTETIPEARRIDTLFRDLVLRRLGIDDPAEQDCTLVRLLVQCWYGVLTASLNGRASQEETESDIRIACRLLLAERSNRREAENAG